MSRWAVVDGGQVLNVVLWDGMSAWEPAAGTAVALPEGSPVGPGWSYDGDEFTPSAVVLSWDGIRVRRDDLLAASDWTQVADAPANQQAWAVYRQALRDIPQDFATPGDVVWPAAP